MELGVGALESLGPMESIWGAWGVFQALAHNMHALEKNAFFGDFGDQEAFGVPGGCTYGVGARKI